MLASVRSTVTQASVQKPAGDRPVIEHEVKSWPPLFEATRLGQKTHDMRSVGDRDYKIGDVLKLREFDPNKGRYTGRELRTKITYITSADQPCALSEGALDSDYCILSIRLIES